MKYAEVAGNVEWLIVDENIARFKKVGQASSLSHPAEPSNDKQTGSLSYFKPIDRFYRTNPSPPMKNALGTCLSYIRR